ncbi:DUF3829 domain-containing protein [Chryseobacterium sp. 2987]|uniref:DUF3829 domain-containing protein n=1 Tax=Chryseobacterium sp. 2987 TaxID=2817767 RepID=UPI002856681F|nr:DUF3829 domain-containing protein [Chryseobacterium sp. 2987]MDR6920985.1 ElaB/YqjD/DUF883 family membrane-anchored ribosome-binding protein [Chryseobacterium sp. 2987]
MKKTAIIAGVFIFSLSAVSCDKLGKIKDKLSQDKTKQMNPFSVNSGDENRDIIAFNNKAVKMDDVHAEFIKNFQNALKQMDDYVKNALANPQYSGMTPLFTPTIMMGAENEMKVPDVLGKDYQVLVDKMISTFSELKLRKKELESYKDAEDWKDDQGKKISELREKADQLIKENRNAANELFTKLAPRADKAEIEVLKNHPLKDQILQSKEIMELSQKIVDDSYNFTDANAYKKLFAQQYQQMEKLYTRNTEEKIPYSEKQKERSYLAFNNSVNDFLGKMRIAQRCLNENSESLNSDLDELEREAGYVLDRYNTFVD